MKYHRVKPVTRIKRRHVAYDHMHCYGFGFENRACGKRFVITVGGGGALDVNVCEGRKDVDFYLVERNDKRGDTN